MNDESITAGVILGWLCGMILGFTLFSGGYVNSKQWKEAETMCILSRGADYVKRTYDKSRVIVTCVDGTEMERHIDE